MNQVTCGITMSVDAFVAGPNQSVDHPFGDLPGPETILHGWMFEEPEKHQAELQALTDAGAFIMGSNMYGPKEKRESPDWKGWWGDNPPYHAPVFVLSHKRRDPIVMEGGTTYTFLADGIEAALSAAKAAAGQRNVAIMGGANTINQYLAAGLLDEVWLHIVPVTLGEGARLFEHVPTLHLEPLEISGTSLVTHIRYRVSKK